VLSATAGALLAVVLAGKPLLQSKLSAEEAKVFNQGKPISTGINFRLPRLTRSVNVLVLGTKVLASDVNDPPPASTKLSYDPVINSLEGLSDTMLLVRFDPSAHQLVVLSLPRDTRTFVDGVGLTKLNEANVVGGPALAAKATSELMGGVGVDRYIRINVQGVEKLVDALGGVTVYVPKDMHYQDDSQHLYINLKQGKQHLNGSQALQFLRFRYDAYGDIGRIQRQQMMMRALFEQALSPAILPRLPQILSVIQSNIDTNLSIEELVALVGFAVQSDRPSTEMLMLPGDFSSPQQFEASYWLPNAQKIANLARQYFGVISADFASDRSSASGSLKVAIQDSTGHSNLVQTVLTALDKAGYGNVYEDSPWGESLATTQIVAQQGDVQSAEAVQSALGFGKVVIESTGDLQSDVTVRLGQDALQFKPTAKPKPSSTPEPSSSAPAPGPASPLASPEPQPSSSSQAVEGRSLSDSATTEPDSPQPDMPDTPDRLENSETASPEPQAADDSNSVVPSGEVGQSSPSDSPSMNPIMNPRPPKQPGVMKPAPLPSQTPVEF
jgi:LCP family protein required for cell wall assembly